jgi:prefoldin subunit 5
MQLKKQFDEEVVMLSQSLQQFRIASNKYEDQKLILKSLAEPTNQGQEILIPLTQCLFINGTNWGK